jgi:amino acid transporter
MESECVEYKLKAFPEKESRLTENMTEEKLVRGIGRWDLTAVVINTIIGAGIFGLPSKVQALIGSYSLYAFVACAVIIAFIVICHAEVASRFSSTGGAYLYAKEAFGGTFAFEVGWVYWIVRLTTFAANCNLFVTYLGFFIPSATDATVRIAIVAAVVIGLSAVNIIGVKQSAVITNVFTVGKLLPLFLFIGVGLFFIRPENFNFDAVPAYASFSSAVLILIYAFVGFEVALIPAAEVKDPQKNYPFALFIALGVVALVYILVQVVSIGTLPNLSSSERPLADAAGLFMGPIGAAIIVAGALISILGNLNVGILGGSRILYALGARNQLPSVLANTHDRFRTPWVAIAINALIIFFLTVQASFLTAVALATITRLLVYATTCASLIVFRRRSDMPPAPFLAPMGVAAAVLSLALIAWLLTNVDFKKEGIPIIIAAVAGFILYLISRAWAKRRTPDDLESV